MIRDGLDPCPFQTAVDFFDILPCACVHDSKRSPPRQFDDGANLLRACGYFAHFEIEVRTIKTAYELRRSLDAELGQDVTANGRRGCRRQSKYRRRLELANGMTKPQVIGSKVMAPERNAMGFVDGEQAYGGAPQPRAEPVILKAFG